MEQMRKEASEKFTQDPVDENDKFLGEIIPFKGVKCKDEIEDYLLKQLEILLTIPGPSGEEEKVLEHIFQEIGKCEDIDNLVVVRDYTNFGLYVFVPRKNKSSNSKTVIFDAHSDTVKKEYISPKVFRSERLQDFRGGKRIIVKGTGLDNRIHCAVLLTMVRFCRFEDIQYVGLFSTEEENGMHGAKFFSKNFSPRTHLNIEKKVDLVIVLDVCSGRIDYDRGAPTGIHSVPVIGGGSCPSRQKYGNYNFGMGKGNENDACNARELKYGVLRNVPKCRYSCPCLNMHSFSSYASVSDMFHLYEVLRDGMDEIILREVEKGNRIKKLERVKERLEKVRVKIREVNVKIREMKRKIGMEQKVEKLEDEKRKLVEVRNSYVEEENDLRRT